MDNNTTECCDLLCNIYYDNIFYKLTDDELMFSIMGSILDYFHEIN